MKLGLALGGILLVVPGLVACGGDEDTSGDQGKDDGATVSVEDFCAAAEKFENTFTEMDTTDITEGVVALKDAAQELKDVGTPEDIPDDAREGLVMTLDKMIALPDDADEDDLSVMFEFSDEEKAKSTAFEGYLDETCDYRDGQGG